MKRIYPLSIIALLGLIATLSIIPGCDELVTKENYYYDTHYDTLTIFEADTACNICHRDVSDTISVARRQYAYSQHALGMLTDYDYLGENTAECGSKCHSNEGFVDFVDNGSASAVSFATEIGCFTCHAPHTNRDFTLRTVAAVTLHEGNFDKDNANLCANCHMATVAPPSAGATNVAIDSVWGPHFSTQADMLMGVGGFEFTAPLSGANPHYTDIANACVGCHQGVSDGFGLGGHSLNLVDNGNQLTTGCNTTACHNGAVSDFAAVSALQQELSDSLDAMYAILVDSGLIEASGVPRDTTIPRDWAGAVYNYMFVVGDGSGGVHNLRYAKELIDSSLVFLRTGVAPTE